MKAIDILKAALSDMGADGLCNGYCECSCSIEHVGICIDRLDECEAAKKREDGLYYPMDA